MRHLVLSTMASCVALMSGTPANSQTTAQGAEAPPQGKDASTQR
ncbi:hypothetical protein ABIF29_005488 [Bradyrhizobium elkanii]|uniref:Uncharacterized protein n=1 Tax=Bradyrhizobium elkanii TaxID=29448 RepID=A0ABV4F5G6_BRAEL|nr:hypothetical protein [Bradyrhizobium elkanii]MCP1976033.1 hypothetical protein [Bradyrhizobium elkanii]MCS3693226.1 hypothetical protein [Bradyrhizobium elkanii]MCS3889450.1 hypothetical protein [Bradyrhizobium elkanii]MCS4211529.1 hypothetical protein [Bradyrhizobium elkanii]